jgi:hypothetical protein
MRVAVQPALNGLSGLDWVREVRRQVTGALSNQDVPFELIAQQLKLKSAKLYQVLFNFQDVRDRITRWGDLDHERVNLLKYGATEDLNFWLVEEKDKIAGGFQYDTDVLLPATADALRDRFVVIVQRLIEQPNRLMTDLLAPTEAETRARQGWQPTALGDGLAAFDALRNASQADDVALRCGTRTVSSVELAKRVQHAADTLRTHLGSHLTPEAVIGVDVADPVAQVVACLAVWQLGLACATPSASATLAGTPGLHAVIGERAVSGAPHLGAHVLPGFVPGEFAPQASSHNASQAALAVTAAQINEAACRLASQLGAGFGQQLAIGQATPAVARVAWVLAARLKHASVQLPDAQGQLGQASSACLHASEALVAVRQGSRRPHAIVLPAPEAQGPILSALFAAPVHVATLLTHPASGLPLAAGWLTDPRDVGVCGQPLLAGLEIVDARGRAVGVNAPGHLAGDAVGDLSLRWRADGQLQCLNLATVDPGAPPSVASIAAAAPTASPPVTPPAQAQAPVASAPAQPKEVAPSPEATLIGIWQNLLGVHGIGPQDNFFELGGNSLLAMVAVDETRKALGVEIDARRFVYESLAQIAASAAPVSSGTPSANDAPQCPPASPDRGAAATAANEGVGTQRKGWLDRARALLGPRTGTDDPR